MLLGENIILKVKTVEYQIDIFTTVNLTVLIIKKNSAKITQQTNKREENSIKETDCLLNLVVTSTLDVGRTYQVLLQSIKAMEVVYSA